MSDLASRCRDNAAIANMESEGPLDVCAFFIGANYDPGWTDESKCTRCQRTWFEHYHGRKSVSKKAEKKNG